MHTAPRGAIHVELDHGRALIGRGAAMGRVWQLTQRVAPADVSVLITGETGTGKELIARLIHQCSGRAAREMIAVDCNALTPTLLESELFGHERGSFTGAERSRAGMFEQANGSTLFLDEIANLPRESQAKLLRVLQEREFRRLGGRELISTDFRLISATNTDLPAAVRAGTFREDLFHRLKVVHIEMPALRDRREDVPLLVSYLVNQKRLRLKRPEVLRVSHEALDVLCSYGWPGNVRELENVIETAVLDCSADTIEVRHLIFAGGDAVEADPTLDDEHSTLDFRAARQRALAAFERLYLLDLLRRGHGSVKITALYAGISTKHIRSLLRRHGIDRRDFRPPARRQRTIERDALVEYR
jgi:DNA-binding NtrC family response regulator